MTLDSFADYCGKSKKTVEGWLNKNYIPGAYIIEGTHVWHIPDNARSPYMKQKKKNGGAGMYKSIAKAVAAGEGICAELYKMPQQRFDVYVNQLIDAGIITSYTAEGVKYYETTMDTLNFSKKSLISIEKFIEAGSKGAAQGITEAVLSTV